LLLCQAHPQKVQPVLGEASSATHDRHPPCRLVGKEVSFDLFKVPQPLALGGMLSWGPVTELQPPGIAGLRLSSLSLGVDLLASLCGREDGTLQLGLDIIGSLLDLREVSRLVGPSKFPHSVIPSSNGASPSRGALTG
jgi:hypothetical protein